MANLAIRPDLRRQLDVPLRSAVGQLASWSPVAIAACCMAFGLLSYARSDSDDPFSQQAVWAFGLRTNYASAILAIFAAAVLSVGISIGHGVDRMINLMLGAQFVLIALAMVFMRGTPINVLNFTGRSCLLAALAGIALLHAGVTGHHPARQRPARVEPAPRPVRVTRPVKTVVAEPTVELRPVAATIINATVRTTPAPVAGSVAAVPVVRRLHERAANARLTVALTARLAKASVIAFCHRARTMGYQLALAAGWPEDEPTAGER